LEPETSRIPITRYLAALLPQEQCSIKRYNKNREELGLVSPTGRRNHKNKVFGVSKIKNRTISTRTYQLRFYERKIKKRKQFG
jgi:hypothetical protein